MPDVNNYIDDGKVARERIAMDVKYRKLKGKELEKIVNDPKIQSAFIGDKFSKKVDKKDWTKDYLERISCAVVAESFNADYLFYLDEVAEYVEKRKVIILIGIAITVVGTLGTSILILKDAIAQLFES